MNERCHACASEGRTMRLRRVGARVRPREVQAGAWEVRGAGDEGE